MWNNLKNFIQNPMQAMLRTRLNIPQNFQGDANDMVQYLLDTGQVTQDQYNRINMTSRQIQENPIFKQFIGGQRLQ